MYKSRILTLIFSLTLLATIGSAMLPQPASALSGSDFQAGRIMDDGIFFNPHSMNSGEIQAFLNSKVPVCDTAGTKPSEYGGGTRAQYSATKGYYPPFTCLKDYVMDVGNVAPDAYCSGGVNAGRKSAADVIKEVSMACGINPQIILVLLQKEQSLVTDDWPWSLQYQKATGYACPDTAACDPQFAGFFNQVYFGVRQFKRYAKDETSFRYRKDRNNYIQYHPNAACGGTNVFIQNQATAGLYNYTPYQPNATALSNIYGSQNDGCSAYGNRNFWRLFNDWFGSTLVDCSPSEQPQPQVRQLFNPATGKHFYTAYQCEVNTVTSKLGYRYEGYAFNTTSSSVSGAVPVYRLYNRIGQNHFWSSKQAEIDALVNSGRFNLEGIAFYTLSEAVDPKYPLYRLYSPGSGAHYWTLSLAHANNLVANHGFRNEGVAFYSQ